MRLFAFRLAGHLHMTVSELLARISARELSEWIAYERIEGPLGGARGDYHAALVASTVANSNRGKGKAHKLSDFLLKWGGKKSVDDTWAALVAGVTGKRD